VKKLKVAYNPSAVVFTSIEWKKYFLIILFYIILNLLLHFIINLVLDSSLNYELNPEVTLDEATSLKFALAACLLAPIIEELIFRLPLVVNKFNLMVSNGFLIYLFSSKYLIGEVYEASLINLLCLFFSFSIPIILYSLDRITNQIVNFLKNHFSLFFYTLLILFGFLHILKYDNATMYLYIFSPIIVLPYILMAYVSSYFRLKYGILFSILFHIINNLPPILILFIYKLIS
jgi:hypothetical protein